MKKNDTRTKELRELERIRKRNGGILRPMDVVEAASNQKNVLHRRFEWDDTIAAHQHRLWQARHMIVCYVHTTDQMPSQSIQCYISLREDRAQSAGGYRTMVDVMSDDTMRAALLRDALHDLSQFKQKYGMLRELAAVFAAAAEVGAK